jgi:serine/threonine protein kinase/Tol biopolymer transport system component
MSNLSSGTRLGPYTIVAAIGAGGMGEVYRAADQRLGREVAIKILPAHFSDDPERLRRFEQEARATAALNHPNIMAVYDVGTREDQSPYVVTELLEGESLRDRLRTGGLPFRKALDYASQVAHGLAAANDKGIVHRDLKPDNLFITRDGRIKILDFGLAKLSESAQDSLRSSVPTEVETVPGIVLGTIGYMSPEQVRGQATDHRSDIFSLGTILYEMISGRRAFSGNSSADVLSAILKEDPPELSATNVAVPTGIDRIIRHCLEKSPEERFQSARDIAFALDDLSSPSSQTIPLTSVPAQAKGKRRLLVVSGAVLGLVVAFIGGRFLATRSAISNAPVFHQLTYRHGTFDRARFTADGKTAIYTAFWEGQPPEIFSVPSRESGGQSLNLKDSGLLSISPNGEMAILQSTHSLSIFLTMGTLAKASANGGAPKAQIENVHEADWTPDGSALALVRYVADKRIDQVEYPAGKVLYQAPFISDLRFSRDGQYLAFIEHPNPADDRGNVVVITAAGNAVVKGPQFDSARGLAWSPSGREVWSTSPLVSGNIFSISLDGQTRTVLQAPGRTHLRDVLPDGRILVTQGIARMGIMFVDLESKTTKDLSWMDWPFLRHISPDGKTILFDEQGNAYGHYTALIRHTDGSAALALGEGYADDLSPDGNSVLATKIKTSPLELWLLPVGAGEPRRLSPPNLSPAGTAAGFMADGKHVIYVARDGNKPPQTYIQDLNGGAPALLTPEGAVGYRISPDDQYLIVNGGRSLFSMKDHTVQPIAGLTPGDTFTDWSGDGQLFVISVNNAQATVYKLNPHTGTRTEWTSLSTAPIAGQRLSGLTINADGKKMAYRYSLEFADLFVIEGLH